MVLFAGGAQGVLNVSGGRLVYYSIANMRGAGCERQWVQSIRSLRRHNPSVEVWLFLFNGASPELLAEAARQRVHVEYLGEYSHYLSQWHLRGGVLALCPTLHKFLVVPTSRLASVAAALYVDCDTFFLRDVERLFEPCAEADWYAREEHASRRSPHGYDPAHIDEDALARIAAEAGSRCVVPFNSGVCLLNGRVAPALEQVRLTLLDMTWRLLCGRELGRSQADEPDQELRAAILASVNAIDRRRSLAYPSRNAWIVEQIALWLALGQIASFSQGFLSPQDVAQGHEFDVALGRSSTVLCHYFSVLEEAFFSRVRRT
jgi:hypothetical protein